MINKNFYRKTNDKKILHKVGKQWKVVSIALLMAIGGGAAVAATNNVSANADVNNGVNQETNATVQSLEQNAPTYQSAAPAKASSKAAPASNKAPQVPNPSLIGESNVNDNNASAAYYRAMQGYDTAVINYYKGTVQGYTNSVNAKLPKQASALNGSYASAENQQKSDSTDAASYSAIAARPNWSAEVSNIAMKNSGIDASAYIETVGANVSAYANSVSSYANELSGASDVASLATLISEINGSRDLQADYHASDGEARANSEVASNEYSAASQEAVTVLSNSQRNRDELVNAKITSADNYYDNEVAIGNSVGDTSLVARMAGTSYGAAYSAVSASVSAYARKFDANLLANDLIGGQPTVLDDVNLGDNYNAADYINAYNESLATSKASSEATLAFNSINAASAKSANLSDVASEAYKVFNNASTAYKNNNNANNANSLKAASESASSAFNSAENKVNSFAATAITTTSGNKVSANANNISSVSSAFSTASVAANSASVAASNSLSSAASGTAGAVYQLVWDTAIQQQYGNTKASAEKTMTSAKAAIPSYAAQLSSANSALNDAKIASASASSAARVLNVLGNDPTLADIVNDPEDGKALVSNASDFMKNASVNSASYSGYNLASTKVAGALESADGVDNGSGESAIVSAVNSAASQVGADYTNESNASNAYTSAKDANFVLASSYATSYNGKAGSDQAAVNSASVALNNFYVAYAGAGYGSANASLTAAQSAEPNDAALAHGYGYYVAKHEPHYINVIKGLVLHSNPDYAKGEHLANIPTNAHAILTVTGVGFDPNGRTRLQVKYNGKTGFVTANPSYVRDAYVEPGTYNVTFNNNMTEYNNMQFNKSSRVANAQVKEGTTVVATAVRNDNPEYWNGLTRLQLSNGNFVTANMNYISDLEATNGNNQAPESAGTVNFWNGRD